MNHAVVLILQSNLDYFVALNGRRGRELSFSVHLLGRGSCVDVFLKNKQTQKKTLPYLLISSFLPSRLFGTRQEIMNVSGTKWDEVSAVSPTPHPLPSASSKTGIKYQGELTE